MHYSTLFLSLLYTMMLSFNSRADSCASESFGGRSILIAYIYIHTLHERRIIDARLHCLINTYIYHTDGLIIIQDEPQVQSGLRVHRLYYAVCGIACVGMYRLLEMMR